MKSIDANIDKAEERLQYYGKSVASLLNKKEYSNFLNIYLKLLYENLIKYQTLSQVKLECETIYVQEKDTQEDKTDETT